MGTIHFKTKQDVEAEDLANWRASVQVSAFQAKAVLARAGYMGQIRQMMNQLDQDDETRIAWENAGSFKRNSPTIAAMAAQLNISEAELDALFEQAKDIEA